jgi:hypothetical protein
MPRAPHPKQTHATSARVAPAGRMPRALRGQLQTAGRVVAVTLAAPALIYKGIKLDDGLVLAIGLAVLLWDGLKLALQLTDKDKDKPAGAAAAAVVAYRGQRGAAACEAAATLA